LVVVFVEKYVLFGECPHLIGFFITAGWETSLTKDEDHESI